MYDYIKECDTISIDTAYITWFAKTNYFRDLYPEPEHLTKQQYDTVEHMFERIYPLYLEDKMFPH